MHNWPLATAQLKGRSQCFLLQAIYLSGTHCFLKTLVLEARLLQGIGIEGDVHSAVTVQH